jgi:hypothetical protein
MLLKDAGHAATSSRPCWPAADAHRSGARQAGGGGEFQALPEALALAAANKRIGNILKKADVEGDEPDPSRCSRSSREGAVPALT